MTDLLDKDGRSLKTHGYGGYSRGCRCERCRQAKADYMRARRASARVLAARFTDGIGAHFVAGIQHGLFGYEERGCRCSDCVAAYRASRRLDALRRRIAAVEGGDTHDIRLA